MNVVNTLHSSHGLIVWFSYINPNTIIQYKKPLMFFFFLVLVITLGLAANLSSYSAHQRWPIYWKSWNSSYIKPIGRMVLVQPPRIQNRSEPTTKRSGSGIGPRIPIGGPICEGWASKEHPLRRKRGLFGSCWACSDPQHLPHNLWGCIL